MEANTEMGRGTAYWGLVAGLDRISK